MKTDFPNIDQGADIVAFGAHPDDIELGCGGTLAKLAAAGYRTIMVDLTAGEMGTRGTVSERAVESRHASELLQAQMRLNLEIPDAGISLTDEYRHKLIEVIRGFQPGVIFAPYPDDRHPDHIHAAKLITESAFYAGVTKVCPDIPGAFRPRRVVYYMMTYEFNPSFLVDISDFFDQKMAAVQAHASQFYNPEYDAAETFIASEDFLEAIRFRARHYGWKSGCRYAEPFWVRESLALDDPMPTLLKNKW